MRGIAAVATPDLRSGLATAAIPRMPLLLELAAPNHTTAQVAGVAVPLAGEDAVDEDGFDAVGALDEPRRAAGEVVDVDPLPVADSGGVEEDDVGGLAGQEAAAVGDA